MRYALVLLMLAGCVSTDERIGKAASTCEKMGYEIGSDAFRNCQLSIVQTEQQKRSAFGAAAIIRSTKSQ